MISHQPNIDKIYVYANDSYEPKNRFLINKCEQRGLRDLKGSKGLSNINDYNPIKKRKLLNVSDDMIAHIAHMISNKTFI